MIEDDYLQDRIRERKWIAKLIENGGCCWICGWSEDPRVIEQHHIARRQNSHITIPICPNCHAILSLGQQAWPEPWTKSDNPPHIKKALMLRGLAELDKMKAMIERQISDEILSERELI